MNQDQVLTSELAHRYPKGMVLAARVQRLKPFGAVVRLDDGTAGIIRSRELSWELEPPPPEKVLAKGQTIGVCVLGIDRLRPHPRLELSLRQAEHDPWSTIHQRYHVGQVARRKVVSLSRNGAFVELEPAVTGFVPLQEVSQSPPERIEEVLWVGDTVDAVITNIDNAERHLRLSLRLHLAETERKPTGFPLGELLSNAQRQTLLHWFKDQSRAVEQHEATGTDIWADLAARFPRIRVQFSKVGQAAIRICRDRLRQTPLNRSARKLAI